MWALSTKWFGVSIKGLLWFILYVRMPTYDHNDMRLFAIYNLKPQFLPMTYIGENNDN
jgi:hypothetical protein